MLVRVVNQINARVLALSGASESVRGAGERGRWTPFPTSRAALPGVAAVDELRCLLPLPLAMRLFASAVSRRLFTRASAS